MPVDLVRNFVIGKQVFVLVAPRIENPFHSPLFARLAIYDERGTIITDPRVFSSDVKEDNLPKMDVRALEYRTDLVLRVCITHQELDLLPGVQGPDNLDVASLDFGNETARPRDFVVR